jgi:hypothetical protein
LVHTRIIGTYFTHISSRTFGRFYGKNIDEKEFYGLVQQGKVNEVMVYRDSFKADVYLTKEAKAELQKGEKKAIRFL